jgi:hypothetical protein
MAKAELLPCPTCGSWNIGIFKETRPLVSYYCFGCGARFDIKRDPPPSKKKS